MNSVFVEIGSDNIIQQCSALKKKMADLRKSKVWAQSLGPGIRGGFKRPATGHPRGRGGRTTKRLKCESKEQIEEKKRRRMMGYSEIQDLARLDPVRMIAKIDNEVKAFVLTINEEMCYSRSDFMEVILEVIFKLTKEVGNHESESAKRILAEILTDRCAQFHMRLRRYINDPQWFSPKVAMQLCAVFKVLLQVLPDCSLRRLPVEELKVATMCSPSFQHLAQDIDELVELKSNMNAKLLTNPIKKPGPSSSITVTWNNRDYRSMPLLPSWEELSIDKPPLQLRPNIVLGPYEDWMHYFDVHFRLLREDFVAPLRRGIASFLDGKKGKDLKGVRIYHSVKIIKPVYSFTGIIYEVQFDNSSFRNCKWEHSKRLLYGSLLCLSPDNFTSTILFATVAGRQPDNLKCGTLCIKFEQGYDAKYICNQAVPYVMVESAAFFEASHHILSCLQAAEVGTMPFTRYIIKTDCTQVDTPKYLKDIASPTYDMSCLYGSEQPSKPILKINILDPKEWPKACDVALDQSQLDAVRLALTTEIAVIQGPPGTGKTYVGLKVVEALLCNRDKWDMRERSPILVMCYTNHALDQFLESIMNIEFTPPNLSDMSEVAKNENVNDKCEKMKPRIARVGGRCKSDKINQYNVEQLLKSCKCKYFNYRWEMKNLQPDLSRGFDNIETRDPYQHSFLTLSELSELGIDYDLISQLKSEYSGGREVERWLGLCNEINLDEPGISSYRCFPLATADQVSCKGEQNLYEACKGKMVCAYNTRNRKGQSIIPLNNIISESNISINEQVERKGVKGQKTMPVNGPLSEGECSDNSDNESVDFEGEADFEESHRMLRSAQKYDTNEGKVFDSAYKRPHKDIKDAQSIRLSDRSEGEYEYSNISINEQVEWKGVKDQKRMQVYDTSDGECSDISHNGHIDFEWVGDFEESHRQLTSDVFDYAWNNEYGFSDIQYVPQVNTKVCEKKEYWSMIENNLFKIAMSPNKASGIFCLFDLSLDQRWQLYNYWLLKKEQLLIKKTAQYSQYCNLYQKSKEDAYTAVLEDCDVIGMTTTGVAKNYRVIQMLKPKIIIVEEAAEVLESHVASALCTGTQHLILIGDHMQLRPKPNEIKLASEYKLDISLFERLVMNHISHSTLNIQHRMRPEIAKLVHPHIYDTLYNHESVLRYDNIKGVAKNIFFINHEYNEEKNDDLLSPSNKHEAEYIAALCKYLLQQGYDASNITVLTPYTGQMLELRNAMPKTEVRFSVVDNFQGEENDIILLSLVRSNTTGKIGFLKHINRICVTLSRAKKGFFCIGNFTLFRQCSTVWDQILRDMENDGCIGKAIPMRCQVHPSFTFNASMPDHFLENAPDGGCTQACEYRLPCGHACSKRCHVKNKEHKDYKCRKPCQKMCSEGHKCEGKCFEACPPCKVKVLKQMQRCGHKQEVPCHQGPETFNCKAPCSKQCINGHPCKKLCSEECGKCEVKMMKDMTLCNHKQMLPCSTDPASIPCKATCHKPCNIGHPCQKYCYKPCGPCEVLVVKKLPNCLHEHRLMCSEDPSTIQCRNLCTKVLQCGHKCMLKCSEPCQSVCIVKEARLLPCGHVVYVECCNRKTDIICQRPCRKRLSCHHMCSARCCDPCTLKCTAPVKIKLPFKHRSMAIECCKVGASGGNPCNTQCDRQLKCGHRCAKLCGEDCMCATMVLSECTSCGGVVHVLCSSKYDPASCRHNCKVTLLCGHKCSGRCGQCYSSRMHQSCPYSVKVKHFCGNLSSPVPCIGLEHQCGQMYTVRCPHSEVTLRCPETPPKCTQPCAWKCEHHSCTKLCHEMCDRPPCNMRCTLSLQCGHKCESLCGEPCLSVCPQCQEKEFSEKVRGMKQEDNPVYIQLVLCEHIYPVTFIDEYMKSRPMEICPRSCPESSCHGYVYTSHRYGNAMKVAIQEFSEVSAVVMDRVAANEEKRGTILMMRGLFLESTLAAENYGIFDKIALLLPEEDTSKPSTDVLQAIHLLLKAHDAMTFIKGIKNVTVKYLQECCSNMLVAACPKQVASSIMISEQLIHDFRSELYRSFLNACCVEASRRCPELSNARFELDIKHLEDYLKKLNEDHFARISEEEFDKYFQSIRNVLPHDVADVKCEIFLGTKCEWYKCNKGHYYGQPPLYAHVVGYSGCPQCQNN